MSSGAIDEYKDDFEDYEDDVDDAVEFRPRAPRLVSTSFTAIHENSDLLSEDGKGRSSNC